MTQITSKSGKRKVPVVSALIKNYYDDLEDLARQYVLSEMGTRTAFQILLQALGDLKIKPFPEVHYVTKRSNRRSKAKTTKHTSTDVLTRKK